MGTYTYTMHKSQHLNQQAFDCLPGQGLGYDGKFGKQATSCHPWEGIAGIVSLKRCIFAGQRSFKTTLPSHLRLITIHAQGRRKKTEYEYATLDDDYAEPSSGNFSLVGLLLGLETR